MFYALWKLRGQLMTKVRTPNEIAMYRLQKEQRDLLEQKKRSMKIGSEGDPFFLSWIDERLKSVSPRLSEVSRLVEIERLKEKQKDRQMKSRVNRGERLEDPEEDLA